MKLRAQEFTDWSLHSPIKNARTITKYLDLMTSEPFHGQILCRNLRQEISLKIISQLHEPNKEANWFPNYSEVENIYKILLQEDITFKNVTIHKDSHIWHWKKTSAHSKYLIKVIFTKLTPIKVTMLTWFFNWCYNSIVLRTQIITFLL